MDYATLVADQATEGSIRYFVRHSLVPAEFILTSAQALIYSRLKVREMKTLLANQSLAAASVSIPLPSPGFLEPISLWLDRDFKSKITILDEDHFEERVGRDAFGALYTGTPTVCTMDGTSFYLDVTTDIEYFYRLWYYKQPAALSVGNPSNFLTDRYPNILEAICTYYAFAHRRMSTDSTGWLTLGMAAIDLANSQYDMAQQQTRTEMYWNNR
jgi:hypothetical protein